MADLTCVIILSFHVSQALKSAQDGLNEVGRPWISQPCHQLSKERPRMHHVYHSARPALLRGLSLFAAWLAIGFWLPALAASPATRVVDINTHQTNLAPAPNDSSTPQHLLAIGNTLYFSADDGSRGRELWR